MERPGGLGIMPVPRLPLPVPSPFHTRTFPLCETLNYREWAGYYAVSAYEAHHEHEYNAIRNAVGVIDVSPLFKYTVNGPDATRLVDRVITRDARKIKPGQVVYTPWCDERGKIIDDGTVTRLEEQRYRWTAADPSLRWFRENARGLNVMIDEISEPVAALAVQGPLSGALMVDVCDADIRGLKYFRVISGRIAGIQVDVSRTGYTGDLGYEIWMPAERAVEIWDVLIAAGARYEVRPAGMLALDMVRIEAGLLLTDVDFFSCRKALIKSQLYSPLEMGLGRLVQLDKAPFVGQQALRLEHARGPKRQIVGLDLDWSTFEALHERVGLAPQVPAAASRVAVPLYAGGEQVGKATSTMWSPILKRLIALATLRSDHASPGRAVEFEVTVDATRHRVPAVVVKTPFFNPSRKTAAIA
jgi:aminomethyltransferase